MRRQFGFLLGTAIGKARGEAFLPPQLPHVTVVVVEPTLTQTEYGYARCGAATYAVNLGHD